MASELAKLDVSDKVLPRTPKPSDPKLAKTWKDPNTPNVSRFLDAKEAAIKQAATMTYLLGS